MRQRITAAASIPRVRSSNAAAEGHEFIGRASPFHLGKNGCRQAVRWCSAGPRQRQRAVFDFCKVARWASYTS